MSSFFMVASSMPLRRETFQAPARQTAYPVRRTSITSVLLIVVLATSASACVAGLGSRPGTSCRPRDARRACAQKKPGTATAIHFGCDLLLKSPPGQCGMRSFTQFQLVAFHAFEISTPLRRATSRISAPLDSLIVVSSIGPPEADRGPPVS